MHTGGEAAKTQKPPVTIETRFGKRTLEKQQVGAKGVVIFTLGSGGSDLTGGGSTERRTKKTPREADLIRVTVTGACKRSHSRVSTPRTFPVTGTTKGGADEEVSSGAFKV